MQYSSILEAKGRKSAFQHEIAQKHIYSSRNRSFLPYWSCSRTSWPQPAPQISVSHYSARKRRTDHVLRTQPTRKKFRTPSHISPTLVYDGRRLQHGARLCFYKVLHSRLSLCSPPSLSMNTVSVIASITGILAVAAKITAAVTDFVGKYLRQLTCCPPSNCHIHSF